MSLVKSIKRIVNSICEFILEHGNRNSSVKYMTHNKALVKVGEYTYGFSGVNIYYYRGSETNIEIGKYCSFGPNVTLILGGEHPTEWISTYPFRIKWNKKGAYKDGMPSTKGPIIIGNDVWIGTDVTILSGVTIGNGAVICTGAVVTSDIPPYTLAGGIPAKVIKKRFSDEDVEFLERIKWWDLDRKNVEELIPVLSSIRIDEMKAYFHRHGL